MSTIGLERIQEVTGEIYSRVFPEIPGQMTDIGLWGTHRRFVVTRMGSTGSTWLAWLLNSHPDVSCTHERILSRIFPRRSYDSNDLAELIRQMALDTMHGAYLAAGDVGSVWAPHLQALSGKFTTALLVRHPARCLNTRLRVYPNDQAYSEIPTWSPPVIRELWDVDLDELCPLDRIFVHDAFIFATLSWLLGKAEVILRLESLQELEYCRKALQQLTGVRYSAKLIASALRRKVNVRVGGGMTIREIVAGFSSQQRHWYRTILRDVAPSFGYDLEDEIGAINIGAAGVLQAHRRIAT